MPGGPRIDPRRLRHGEIIAGLGGLVLLVALFAVPWFGDGHGSAVSGWNAMPILRWFVLVVGVAGVSMAVLQATCATPAIPVTAAVIVTLVGGLGTLLLVVRLFTGSTGPEFGAFIGVAAAFSVVAGAWRSMRQEGGWTPGPGHPVPIIPLAPRQGR